MTRCSHVFKRGKNKGNVCGSARCKLHNIRDETPTSQTSLTDLPIDVLDIVLKNVGSHITRCSMRKPDSAIKSLTYLSATCKSMHAIVGEDVWEVLWNTYLDTLKESDPFSVPERIPSVSAKQNLMLHVLIGCQFCKTPRIRKIHYPFAVRCCTDCLYARTISGWRLKTEYRVPEHSFAHLPHTKTDMYSRYNGYYEVLFYWIAQVENALGTTLEEHLEKHERNEEIAKEALRRHNDQNLQLAVEALPYDTEFVFKNTKYEEFNRECPKRVCIKDILDQATRKFNVITNDVYIKTHMKQVDKNLTLTDIRKTTAYKKVSESGALDDKVPWQDIIDDIVETRRKEFESRVLADAQKEHHYKNLQMPSLRNCEIVKRKMCEIGMEKKTLGITDEEWAIIKKEVPPIGNPKKSGNRTMRPCEICGTSRLFCEMGLESHYIAKHL